MKTIGVLFHPRKPESEEVATQVKKWLDWRQIAGWIAPNADETERHEMLPATDLLVILGGDGATLRAARLAAGHNAPLLCINMGRIGFLSEATLDNWQDKLSQFLVDEYWLESRLMLNATVQRDETAIHSMMALNDVVVGRGTQARVVRLKLYVDGVYVTDFTADGLIIATPTGSTAYSMAAGGPLLPPSLQNFLAMPVAPHLSLNRALVLHREAVISVQVEMNHDAMATADGQSFYHLQSDDQVVLQKHEQETHFVRMGEKGYFYQRLMERLGINRPN